VVLMVGALVVRPGTPVTSDSARSASTGATDATVLVRLVVLQPEARTVDVAGDFNGWDPTRTPLEQAASGAWTVTIPLQPGRYEYMFVVDGKQWVGDPFAVEQADDGFGLRNAVLDVRPAEASL
jgi:1,4-alpha-glucan branching enzyme